MKLGLDQLAIAETVAFVGALSDKLMRLLSLFLGSQDSKRNGTSVRILNFW